MADATNTTNPPDEEWRRVEGWPYEVSSLGRVRRITYLIPGNSRGYKRVMLSRGAEKKSKSVHQLVCEAFCGPRPSPEHVVAHYDGNRGNNTPTNLRWATAQENLEDSIRHGIVHGEGNPSNKLKAHEVLEIIALRDKGLSCRAIARKYSVAETTIENITKGKKWGWLTGRGTKRGMPERRRR